MELMVLACHPERGGAGGCEAKDPEVESREVESSDRFSTMAPTTRDSISGSFAALRRLRMTPTCARQEINELPAAL
jgi:hypothetical protein